jgi:hypothetical protein
VLIISTKKPKPISGNLNIFLNNEEFESLISQFADIHPP